MGELVFWQVQNPHRLEELDVGRDGFDPGVADVPLFQVRLLLQGVGELLEQVGEWLAPGPQRGQAHTKPRNTSAHCKSRTREGTCESVSGDCSSGRKQTHCVVTHHALRDEPNSELP